MYIQCTHKCASYTVDCVAGEGSRQQCDSGGHSPGHSAAARQGGEDEEVDGDDSLIQEQASTQSPLPKHHGGLLRRPSQEGEAGPCSRARRTG